MYSNNITDNVPVLFHPTKSIMIDDHISFPKMLANFLMPERVIIEFSNPEKVIEYLEIYEQQFSFKNFYQEDLLSLLHYLNNEQRFTQIGTIFCDYNMPTLNGIEIFAMITKLTKRQYQRILLTGISEEQTQQINDLTTIDNILFKDKLANELNAFLPNLIRFEHQFFIKTYNTSIKLSILKDLQFITDFTYLTEKYCIIEAYLIENGTRFILLDREANIYEISLHKEKELEIKPISNTFGISIFSYEDYITQTLS